MITLEQTAGHKKTIKIDFIDNVREGCLKIFSGSISLTRSLRLAPRVT